MNKISLIKIKKYVIYAKNNLVLMMIIKPAELRRHAEVQADRLGVADVEVAVGLRREAGHHLIDAPRRQIAEFLQAIDRGDVPTIR